MPVVAAKSQWNREVTLSEVNFIFTALQPRLST